MKGKRVMAVALSAALLGTAAGVMAGCNNKGDKLIYWVFDRDMAQQVRDYYATEERNLGYEIEIETVPLESMLTRLDNALRTGTNLPDVVALEEQNIKKYIDEGAQFLEPLDEYKDLTANMYDYTVEAATGPDGHLYALATNVTPGVFAYRRSMAEAVFGTDDPEEIQKHFDTWEHFLESARTLKDFTGGGDYPEGIKVISSYMDIGKVFCGSRTQGWVDENNHLVIDSSLTEGEYSMMEVAKTLQTEDLSHETTSGDGTYYSDVWDNKVFGFFQATWGLNTNLKNNCTDSSGEISSDGDWAIIPGPAAYFEGGTYHVVIKGTKWLDEAKEFVKFFSTDETYLKNWAKEHGDFMNNKQYMQDLVTDETANNAFLGGQNPYSIFIEQAEKINGEIITRYDSEINSTFEAWATNYAELDGKAPTISEAVTQFKNAVAASLTSITVD